MTTSVSTVFRGLGVSSGSFVGTVHVIDRLRVTVSRAHVSRERVEAERNRLLKAVAVSEEQLETARTRANEQDGLGRLASELDLLLKAHILMLRDPMLLDGALDRISNERKNAEWALVDALREIRRIFDGIELDYFRERRSDVDSVGDRILRNLVGAETDTFANVPEDAVIVAHDLSPADAVALTRFKVRAFVLEEGGRTSHIAILARAARAPAVLGVRGILEVAGSGDRIAVDGHAGLVVLDPTDDDLLALQGKRERRAEKEARLLGARDLIAETTDGDRIELLGNVEVPEEIPRLLESGAEGIGLYRTEFMVLGRGRVPTEAEHRTEYQELAEALHPRPVTIRTLDLGADKLPKGDARAKAKNPALALRAIRASLSDPGPFRDQLRGVFAASAHGRVRLLLPLVSTVSEVRRARAIIENVKLDLQREGIPFDPDVPVGAMIETPAAVFIADQLAAELDFFSIGTNDLIQYSMAADRQDPELQSWVSPAEPSVLRMIRHVVTSARDRGIHVSVCGEMAGDPFYVPLLVGLGVRSLSMVPESIPLAKQVIRRISRERCAELAASATELSTAEDVESRTEAYLMEVGIELDEDGQVPRFRRG